MKPLVAAIIAFALCVFYPPWRPFAQWKETSTGKPINSSIARTLDHKFFGVLPCGYGWFWQPPEYTTLGTGYSTNLAPGSNTRYEMRAADITTGIYFGFLFFQGCFVALGVAVLTSGLTRISLRFRDLFKVMVSLITLIISAWFAFIGGYGVFVLAGTGLFPHTGRAMMLLLLGAAGVVSSICLLRFPKRAGIVGTLSILCIAGMGVFTIFMNSRPYNVLFSRGLQIGFLVLLSITIYILFCRARESSDVQADANEQ